MRYLFVYLLVAVMLYQNVVSGFYLGLRGLYVRQKMAQRIEKGDFRDKIQTFVFAEREYENLNWKKKGKEFAFRETMYDVVKRKKMGKEIHLYCIQDKEEKRLEQKIKKWVNERDASDPFSAQNSLKNILASCFTIQENKEEIVQAPMVAYKNRDFFLYSDKTSLFRPVIDPKPPQIFC